MFLEASSYIGGDAGVERAVTTLEDIEEVLWVLFLLHKILAVMSIIIYLFWGEV
jgi:hypothetical protein